ncbi:MAG: hypothetical protein HY749_16295 [Gammaproteobacteria bacterium]|nr:hypothetical protein [Gammaproteobacteria bacterium]
MQSAVTSVVGDTPEEQDGYSRLDAFGMEIAKYRKEAVDGRVQIGIEEEWLEDEEAYVGIDAANRGEHLSTWRHLKPSKKVFSTANSSTADPTRSTALVNITRPYCDAAAARVADMLLPNDDRCWGLDCTPLPDLAEQAQPDVAVIVADASGGQMEVSHKVFMDAVVTAAKARMERAETQIEDWLGETKWSAECRVVIEDTAKLGTGVLKGPYPKAKRKVRFNYQDGQSAIAFESKTVPHSRRVDVWNCFPDPSCGENIQDGAYFFERDEITLRKLLALKTEPGYIAAQIEACAQEGPIGYEVNWTPSIAQERTAGLRQTKYEIWYFYGMVERDALIASGLIPEQLTEDYYSAVVTMVNHRVVKAAIMPLEDGSFPYDFMVWQRRPGLPYGIGVSRQIRIPQRMLTAAIRNLMDNAALSAGPQIIIDTTKIVPANGKMELVPRKVWIAKTGDDVSEIDVEKAFTIVHIETRQPELMNIIEFSLRMAEESTGLPMILQGQLGEQNPQTLGQQQMLQNNASSVLRRLAKLWDDRVTVPHLTRYYHWLMEYGDDDVKGDFEVIAHGSSTLVERDIQNQGIALLMDLSWKAPALGLDPEKTTEEYIRSQHLAPARFTKDEQQKEAEAEAQPEQPQDPSITAAAITADAQLQKQTAANQDRQAERDQRWQEKLLDKNTEVALYNAEQALKETEGSGV